MTFLIAEEVNLSRGIFLVRQMSKFLAVGWDSSPFPGFPINIYGDTWGIILRDNVVGNYFVLRDLVPTSFFK